MRMPRHSSFSVRDILDLPQMRPRPSDPVNLGVGFGAADGRNPESASTTMTTTTTTTTAEEARRRTPARDAPDATDRPLRSDPTPETTGRWTF